ncbi:MAG: hypothetical protein JWN10_780 [Solirubrobacterales bacterium]|nr:hypothetical protein [Solirubrobacterales bacterium]
MEVLFILVVLAVIVAIVAALVLASASALRRRKLAPERDKLAQPSGEDQPRQERPEHVAVDTEQRTRFVGSR